MFWKVFFSYVARVWQLPRYIVDLYIYGMGVGVGVGVGGGKCTKLRPGGKKSCGNLVICYCLSGTFRPVQNHVRLLTNQVPEVWGRKHRFWKALPFHHGLHFHKSQLLVALRQVYFAICCVLGSFFVNLIHARVMWEGGNLNWENAPNRLACGYACGAFSW